MPRILKVRPRSSQEIETIAHKIIKNFQPDALKLVTSFDVESYFELGLEKDTGFEPVYDYLPKGIDGYTDCENMKCVISLDLMEYGDSQVTKRRLRATQAHEIGHCFLHLEDARKDKDSEQKFLHNKDSAFDSYHPQNIKTYEDPEWQAWRFASALLMPENCFRRAVDRNFTKQQIKRAFDVNPSFIEVRLQELKISKQIRHG